MFHKLYLLILYSEPRLPFSTSAQNFLVISRQQRVPSSNQSWNIPVTLPLAPELHYWWAFLGFLAQKLDITTHYIFIFTYKLQENPPDFISKICKQKNF